MASRRFAVAAFAAVVAVSTRASARELEYSAPDSCPSRASVKERIDREPGGRDVSILVQKDGATHRGVIAIGEGADRISRTVEARSCAAVVDALVLVAAMDQAPPEKALREEPWVAPSVEVVSPPANVDRPIEAPKPESPGSKSFTNVGGGFNTVDFMGNDRFASFFVMGEIVPDIRLFEVSWMRPSFALKLSRSLTNNVDTLPERVSFTLTSASVDVCPLGDLRPKDFIRVALCTRMEVGALAASIPSGSTATRGFASIAPLVFRPQLYFSNTGVRPHLFFENYIAAPLIRERFRVLDETIRPDAVAWGSSIGFGVTLP